MPLIRPRFSLAVFPAALSGTVKLRRSQSVPSQSAAITPSASNIPGNFTVFHAESDTSPALHAGVAAVPGSLTLNHSWSSCP